MRVLMCGQFKGGIGKTTHNLILAKQLAERGYKVLFIDFDSQMNGTSFIFLNSGLKGDLIAEKNIFRAFQARDIAGNIVKLDKNLHFVPGSKWVNQFEELMNKNKVKDRHLFVRNLLEPIKKSCFYDFCIFDMSPTNSTLNTSVISAVMHHIVVTQSDYFSMQMVPDYIQNINVLQKKYNVPTSVLGISISLLDSRSALEKKVVETIKKNYKQLPFNSIIRRKAALKNYTAFGYPVKKYKRDKIALSEYSALTDEILDRLNMLNNMKVGGVNGQT